MSPFKWLFIKMLGKTPDEDLEVVQPTACAQPPRAHADNIKVRQQEVSFRVASLVAQLSRSYPHIADSILDIWGTKECEDFLHTLIFDVWVPDEQHKFIPRQGFRSEVMRTLMELHDEHDLAMPSQTKSHYHDMYR